MTTPLFRKQSAVWSLSDSVFVVPQSAEFMMTDLLPSTVEQLVATLNGDAEVVHIIDSAKFVSNGGGGVSATDCPTEMRPGGQDPIDPDINPAPKCPHHPPYDEKLPQKMTIVQRPSAGIIVKQTASMSEVMATINGAASDTGFWLLTASNNDLYLVTFPAP